MVDRLLCMPKSRFVVLVIALCLLNCRNESRITEEVARIEVDLKVSRFDREFAQATPADISNLKSSYPYLFPEQYPDSVWVAKLQDTLQLELLGEVANVFPDFNEEAEKLGLFFKYTKFYFPHYVVPKVITVTSDVDYNNRVILTDSLLLVGLDNYLGEDHKFYGGIERYIATGLDQKYLSSDVASAFAKKVNSYPSDRSFLARMIYYGKELYIKDKLIPFESDAVRIGYSEDELAWAQANEEQIWRYFIERELLYSTDLKLGPRFLDPAPFSKFRLEEIDNESPGRIGRYVGWQIVRAYAENNPIGLQQLLSLPAEEIFKNSNYKPKK